MLALRNMGSPPSSAGDSSLGLIICLEPTPPIVRLSNGLIKSIRYVSAHHWQSSSTKHVGRVRTFLRPVDSAARFPGNGSGITSTR
eukprot:scaffold1268_cov133-Skeletonema_marinoi.AAC.9